MSTQIEVEEFSERIKSLFAAAIDQEASSLLARARSAENGKSSVSAAIKFVAGTQAVSIQVKLSRSDKTVVEEEGLVNLSDPNQPNLIDIDGDPISQPVANGLRKITKAIKRGGATVHAGGAE